MSLIIFLVWVSYSADLLAQPNTRSQPRSPIVQNTAQQRVQVIRQLREQVRQWRTQAIQIKRQEIAQTLEEIPKTRELDIMVGANWDQVTKLLISEMRNRQTSRWEKVYVGRHLIALLDRASKNDLAGQAGLLVPAFLSAPTPIRDLPEPSVKFPVPQQRPGAKQTKEPISSEAYLRSLRQAKDDAKKRNAQDEQIILINQSVDVLGRDFTALLLENSDRGTYLAVIKKLHQQLRDTDASFVGTIEALEAAGLERLDIALAKLTLNKLGRLTRAFAGPRQYSIYTEVKKQQDKRSEFGQIELDFQELIENTLSKLGERIERTQMRESSEPVERTPEPMEKTPRPKRKLKSRRY